MDTKLTPQQFLEEIQKNQPYLIMIAQEVESVGEYGKITFEISKRGGFVESMHVIQDRQWLARKQSENKNNVQINILNS